MPMFHAVPSVDHQRAQVPQFDAEHVQAHKVKAHSHPTARHGSKVRTEQESFSAVCDALGGIATVLVAASKTGLADFRHHVQTHRPLLASRIVAYEAVDHPSENQLIAMARQYFLKGARMVGAADAPLRAAPAAGTNASFRKASASAAASPT